MAKKVCAICGIPWKDGFGFVGEHIFPCWNARYNETCVVDAKDYSVPREEVEIIKG